MNMSAIDSWCKCDLAKFCKKQNNPASPERSNSNYYYKYMSVINEMHSFEEPQGHATPERSKAK